MKLRLILTFIGMALFSVLTAHAERLQSGKGFSVVEGNVEFSYRVNSDPAHVTLFWIDATTTLTKDGYDDRIRVVVGETVEIPSTVTYNGATYNVTRIGIEIPEQKFDDLYWLTIPRFIDTLILPESITEYEDVSFLGWINAKSFRVSGNSKIFSTRDGILLDANESKLIRYPVRADIYPAVPESVNDLAPYAYRGCSDALPVPKGMTTIPEGLYVQGVALQPLPESVKTIEPFAFYAYNGNGLIIPENVETIGRYAFAKGYSSDGRGGIAGNILSGNLAFVMLPSGIKSLGTNSLGPVMSQTSDYIMLEQYPNVLISGSNLPDDLYKAIMPRYSDGSMQGFQYKLTCLKENFPQIEKEFWNQYREAFSEWKYEEEFINEVKTIIQSLMTFNRLNAFPDIEITQDKNWDNGYADFSCKLNNPDAVTVSKIEWASQNPSVLEVTKEGNAHAKRPGKMGLSCKLTVKSVEGRPVDMYYFTDFELNADQVGVSEINNDSPSRPDAVYDLNGRQYPIDAEGLQPGIYIRIRDGKVSKYVVK